MKLKSTLWALAFACAAVSCSDDLDEGPNGNNGQEADGIKTYVKVAINTGIGTKVSTRSNPDGGEGTGTELGLKDEYKVNDVTLILFDNKDNTSATTEDQKKGFEFLAGSNIRGVGHADVEEQGSSGVPQHGWAATVQVVMDEKQSAGVIENKYGVIAVTNLGKENDLFKAVKGEDNIAKISTGKDLADFMIKNDTYMTNEKGFVMSTHAMKWKLSDKATETESVVEIEGGVDEEHAATVSVFVERLAAKIRIKDYTSNEPAGGSIEKFLYTLNGGDDGNTPIAKVRLDQVAIVNQLTSGSYLLKRVSGIVVGGEAVATNYLGDEIWENNGNGDCNYVMDPWYGKHKEDASLPTNDAGEKLTYTNRFGGTNDQNYSDMWKGFTSSPVDLATAEEGAYNDNDGIRLAYVMENVQQKEFSLNGYSTGALFKATYYPDQLTIVKDNGETEAAYVSYDGTDGANSSELNSITSDGAKDGVDFYEYRGELFASQEAIFAHIINKSSSDKENYNYTKFTSSKFFSMTIKDYNDHFAHVAEPFKYIDALNEKVKTYTTSNPSADLSKKMMNELPGAQDFTTFMTDKTKQSFGDAKFYDAGVCYYPYWIRHANNNKPAVMGVMEFAIVRNNIYDLTVKGMNSWGFSGTDIPDPEDPDEDGTARINVELYVKNWVVRSNGDIIL